jgi:hypothetical protein
MFRSSAFTFAVLLSIAASPLACVGELSRRRRRRGDRLDGNGEDLESEREPPKKPTRPKVQKPKPFVEKNCRVHCPHGGSSPALAGA